MRVQVAPNTCSTEIITELLEVPLGSEVFRSSHSELQCFLVFFEKDTQKSPGLKRLSRGSELAFFSQNFPFPLFSG